MNPRGYQQNIREQVGSSVRPVWTPLKPRPLAADVQRRMDAYKAIPSLAERRR